MLRGRTLRAQLSIVYAGALLLALALFAAISLVTLDRTARATLDQRLLSDANAVAAITKVKHHGIKLDSDDRAQFAEIIGVTADGAIFAQDGTALVASQATIPEPVRRFAQSATQGTRIGTVALGASSVDPAGPCEHRLSDAGDLNGWRLRGKRGGRLIRSRRRSWASFFMPCRKTSCANS